MSTTEEPAEPGDDPTRILVVDDHHANVVLARRILRSGGYSKVRSATDSRDALLLTHSWRPDLILLDLHMPHIGGTEFIQRLRSSGHAEPIPVLVVTGDDDPDALERARRAGAGDCLVKPIQAEELLAKVRALLAG